MVTKFAGHIACDPDSCSELVVPIMYKNVIYGVIDIDSTVYRRFGSNEEETVEAIANLISTKIAKQKTA